MTVTLAQVPGFVKLFVALAVKIREAPFMSKLFMLTVAEAVHVMTAVLAVIVKLVPDHCIALPLRARDIADEPSVIVRVPEPAVFIILPLIVWLLVSKPPEVIFMAAVAVVGVFNVSAS